MWFSNVGYCKGNADKRRNKKLDENIDEIIRMWNEGYTLIDISNRFSCSITAVRLRLGGSEKMWCIITSDMIWDSLDIRSIEETAKYFNISIPSVTRLMEGKYTQVKSRKHIEYHRYTNVFTNNTY